MNHYVHTVEVTQTTVTTYEVIGPDDGNEAKTIALMTLGAPGVYVRPGEPGARRVSRRVERPLARWVRAVPVEAG